MISDTLEILLIVVFCLSCKQENNFTNVKEQYCNTSVGVSCWLYPNEKIAIYTKDVTYIGNINPYDHGFFDEGCIYIDNYEEVELRVVSSGYLNLDAIDTTICINLQKGYSFHLKISSPILNFFMMI